MKRFRLSTLMLLVVIAALASALVVQHHRSSRREAELQARLANLSPYLAWQRKTETHWERDKRTEDMQKRMDATDRRRPR